MLYVKWVVALVSVALVGGFLHWSLPSRDVVRILNTEVARRTVETETPDGGTIERSQDVRYIVAVSPDEAPRVYRNEDTGWGWPPYFKFNSANLAAEAENAVAEGETGGWVVVRHYGWRIPLISAFPNALSIRPASGPAETAIPWFNIAVYAAVAVGALLLRRAALRLVGGR